MIQQRVLMPRDRVKIETAWATAHILAGSPARHTKARAEGEAVNRALEIEVLGAPGEGAQLRVTCYRRLGS